MTRQAPLLAYASGGIALLLASGLALADNGVCSCAPDLGDMDEQHVPVVDPVDGHGQVEIWQL